jgi:hypothetical protein
MVSRVRLNDSQLMSRDVWTSIIRREWASEWRRRVSGVQVDCRVASAVGWRRLVGGAV